MDRIVVLLIILICVVIFGLSLHTLLEYKPFPFVNINKGNWIEKEGFVDTKYDRNASDAAMTGYVTVQGGDIHNTFKPDSGSVHPQLENVPTATEYLIGRMKRYKMYIPFNNTNVTYHFGSQDKDILQKFARGSNPDIILNPDSDSKHWVLCDIERECKEYVHNSRLYCPIGMDRLQIQTPTGKHNERRYQGCYSAPRQYHMFACRSNDPKGGCRILRDRMVQRVGSGFVMYPPSGVMDLALKEATNNNEKGLIREFMNSKSIHIRNMLLSYTRDDIRDNIDAINKWSPSPLEKRLSVDNGTLDRYLNSIYDDCYLLFQPRGYDSEARIGFVTRKDKYVNVPKLGNDINYDITSLKFIPDTTKDPMPLLRPMISYPRRPNTNQLVQG